MAAAPVVPVGRVRSHSATCLPSSITRLGGSSKKSVAGSATRDITLNSRLRHSAIRPAPRGRMVSRPEVEAGAGELDRLASDRLAGERFLDQRCFHEAVTEDHAEEALAQILHLEAMFGGHLGDRQRLDRQQDHPTVQHAVVLDVVQQHLRQTRATRGS